MNSQWLNRVGWIASFLSSAMYVSYIDQIRLNLIGQKGSLILPFVTTLNALAWFSYGYFRPQKEWPIVVCNFIGIVLGIVATLTAL